MSNSIKCPYEYMTIEEYRTLPENFRIEIIKGEVYDLAAPSAAHQTAVGELYRQFANYLHGKQCRPFFAPYDVYLDEKTVVQPDVIVVCNSEKRKSDGCHGAPDLVIEVMSPSSVRHDMVTKMNLYAKHGVREYWVVDLETPCVQVFLLRDGKMLRDGEYVRNDKIKVDVLDDCEVELEYVFESHE